MFFQFFDPFGCQEALKRAVFIAKLYQHKLFSDSVFFGYLYQALTIGHFLSSSNEYVDDSNELTRSRIVLTVLKTLIGANMNDDFYAYLDEYLAMLRCYLGSKTALSDEIYELASDVYSVFISHHMVIFNIFLGI